MPRTVILVVLVKMAMNKPKVAFILSLKTLREYIHVALVIASLLPTVLKTE